MKLADVKTDATSKKVLQIGDCSAAPPSKYFRIPRRGIHEASQLPAHKIKELIDAELHARLAFRTARSRALDGDEEILHVFNRIGISRADLEKTKSKDRKKERDRLRELIHRIQAQGVKLSAIERSQIFGSGPPVKSILLPNAGDNKKGIRLVLWAGPGGLAEYLDRLTQQQNPQAA
jgi:hypothetical protein